MVRLKGTVLRTAIRAAAGAGAVLAFATPAMAAGRQIAPAVNQDAEVWFGSLILPESLGLPGQDFLFVSPDLSVRTIPLISNDAALDPRLPRDEASWISAALKAALLRDGVTPRGELESALLAAFDAVQQQTDAPLTFFFESPEHHGGQTYTTAHETEQVYAGHRTPGGVGSIRRTLTWLAATNVDFHELNLVVSIDEDWTPPVHAPLPTAVLAGLAAMTLFAARRTTHPGR